MEKMLITVNSKQDIDDEGVIVTTPGEFYKKDDVFYAVYEETAISGMDGTTTTIKLEDDKVSLIRTGKVASTMLFEVGKDNYTLYNTPYGTLDLKIVTNAVNVDIDENGGEAKLDYFLNFQGQAKIKTELEIKIERP